LPSKYAAYGLLVAVVALLYSLFQENLDDGRKEFVSEIKSEIKRVYKDIKTENNLKKAYVDRYLKDRVAEIISVRVTVEENKANVHLYYQSYWEGLTSGFSASAEVRRIENMNKVFAENEGWEAAALLNRGRSNDDIFYLGEFEYVIITGLRYGDIYDVRIVDHSYDSDEPPSLPFRFKVIESK